MKQASQDQCEAASDDECVQPAGLSHVTGLTISNPVLMAQSVLPVHDHWKKPIAHCARILSYIDI